MNKVKKHKKLVAGIAVAVALAGTGTVFAANFVAGPQPNGTGVTSHGWTLTPAGEQLTLGDFPMNATFSPDHRYLVTTNDGQGTQSLQVVDTKLHKVTQTVPYNGNEALYLGIAFSPNGKTLYASAGGNNKIRVFAFDNGTLTEKSPIVMADQNNTDFYPAGLSVSNDGKFLFVANNIAGSVCKIDVSAGKLLTTTSVGKNPYTAYLSQDGHALYVSNWGENSVTVLNPDNMSVVKTVKVGLHPNAIAENPVTGMIYVSDSDSDQISVMDPKQEQVVQTIPLASEKTTPTGSCPDALTVSPDGMSLYIANAGDNDITVVDLKKGEVKGLIPTAWYPTGVFFDQNKLLVLNAKGLGAGPNKQGQYIGNMMAGTMSFIDVPDEGQLLQYTEQVRENNRIYKTDGFGWLQQHAPIQHVIYVIKENRTYDQVFGDISKGNGDKTLTMFGQDVTPNLHKLANQYVLLDNFYADAEISAQGHNWATAADSNDYTEKNWLANYSGRNRGYDFEGQNPAAYTQAGHIWNSAQRSGVSFRDYGEFTDWASNGVSAPTDPSIGNHYDPNYPSWSFDISDVQREQEWAKEYDQFEKTGNLPQLEIVRLPNDHTQGTKPGVPTPQAYVAQNDYALGQLVDKVSHSKDWKDTAIVVTEDDAQNGLDHVDAHRTESLVISPYTQTGKVDSTFYDTASMIRTIELLLGMKPMTQFDASSIPMFNSFTNHPNFAAYDVVQPTYPLDKTNGQNAPMAKESAKLDFSKADEAPEDVLNQILWKATKGNTPYPNLSH